jgi:hypothetical protein
MACGTKGCGTGAAKSGCGTKKTTQKAEEPKKEKKTKK